LLALIVHRSQQPQSELCFRLPLLTFAHVCCCPWRLCCLLLSVAIVLVAGMIMFASAICVRAGAVSQAAFEIIRQAWIISVQVHTWLRRATAFTLCFDRAVVRKHACMVVDVCLLCLHMWCRLSAPRSEQLQFSCVPRAPLMHIAAGQERVQSQHTCMR
jgi:hypothetical protein